MKHPHPLVQGTLAAAGTCMVAQMESLHSFPCNFFKENNKHYEETKSSPPLKVHCKAHPPLQAACCQLHLKQRENIGTLPGLPHHCQKDIQLLLGSLPILVCLGPTRKLSHQSNTIYMYHND